MRIEYLYGQSVEEVRKRGGVGFALRFTDGRELIYEDSDVTVPEQLQGQVFTHATFSNDDTTLWFSKPDDHGNPTDTREKIVLSPMLVGVKDNAGEMHWPARSEEGPVELPPDPSSERVAEGPEEPSDEASYVPEAPPEVP